jgi:hypothetical protein
MPGQRRPRGTVMRTYTLGRPPWGATVNSLCRRKPCPIGWILEGREPVRSSSLLAAILAISTMTQSRIIPRRWIALAFTWPAEPP